MSPLRRAALVFPLGLAALLGACREGPVLVAPRAGVPSFSTAAGFPPGVVATFAATERPEGIAVDKAGDIFVGISTTGTIYRLRRGAPGSGSVQVSVAATAGAGVLGLAVDTCGDLYAAVASFNPTTHGVWRLRGDGTRERLPGSSAIFFPNALAFDKSGNLYVTSSSGPPSGSGTWVDGQIWRIPPQGTAALWLQHALLTGTGSPLTAPPFPLGANGIAQRHGDLFVVNTEKGLIVRVRIDGDGPGEPVSLAGGFSFPDGIALDVFGDLYVVEVGLSRLARVAADGSVVEPMAGPFDGVHFATSLAFGAGAGDRRSLFLANAALPLPHPAPVGPSVLNVEVGVPGLPLP